MIQLSMISPLIGTINNYIKYITENNYRANSGNWNN